MNETLPKREWRELYAFAVRYAKHCRTYSVDIDEAVNEMLLTLYQVRWKNPEYAKRVMRNRLKDVLRRRRMIERWEHPLAEAEQAYRDDSESWDAKLIVEDLLTRLSPSTCRTLKHLMSGHTIQEIANAEHINRRTISRHLHKARELYSLYI